MLRLSLDSKMDFDTGEDVEIFDDGSYIIYNKENLNDHRTLLRSRSVRHISNDLTGWQNKFLNNIVR